MPAGGCALVPTETILNRYRDFRARVPQGLYYDADPARASWETQVCSSSADETTQRATALLGSAAKQFETVWFYETVSCQSDVRHAYRNVRCDYFDGSMLANASAVNLGFMESMLWWATKANVTGSALINYSVTAEGAADTLELCTIRTERGNPSGCDEIIVQSKKDRISAGVVTFGETTEIATILGDCY